MKIVLAPDSFKESVGAPDAAAAMTRGVRAVEPTAQCVEIPMSDGGEGFTEAIAAGLGAQLIEVPAHDPLGRSIAGQIAVAEGLAAFEVASAVGLDLVDGVERDVLGSSSRGVGDLLIAALDHVGLGGKVIVGLGGSATSDGGAGMLAALGARFLDHRGEPLEPNPRSLAELSAVDLGGIDSRLGGVQIEAACDVRNPLLGADGAAAVFGPQKGASPEDVKRIDDVLAHLVSVADSAESGAPSAEVARAEGAGAAGGLGWALMAFCGAQMRPGVELVAQTVGLAGAIADADLVLTGEGSVDAQTRHGKAPAGVAGIAREAGVPCVVLAGRVAPDADVLLDLGVDALVPIVPSAVDLATALRHGAENLERATATVMRLIAIGR